MSKNNTLKVALGAVVVTGLGVAGVANAEQDIFSMNELHHG